MLAYNALGDRFDCLAPAGSGGMGTVFRARDRLSGGIVALKVMRCADPLDVERFMREATILAGLRHPGIVGYVDHGITPRGEHYLAMEWLEGEDLGFTAGVPRADNRRSLGTRWTGRGGTLLAHRRGLVHRDLKPSNLFLVNGEVERVKLVDFGIARLSHDTRRITRTGVLLGTPGYMAPEQIEGCVAQDPRADVFSLGCVLFECLTHRPPFEGVHAMAVLAKILLQEAPRVRSHRQNVGDDLDDLVARMMAKNPDGRPRDAEEVVREITKLTECTTHDTEARPAAARVDDGARPPSTGEPAVSPNSLTLSEQRLVSVVLAGDPQDVHVVTVAAAPELPEVEATVERFGGHVHPLIGGTMVVTLWSPGTAVDRAERAAQCALALRARFPLLPITVVTGRGLVTARVVADDVIDRGVRALVSARLGAVHVDETTAGMLSRRFRVDRDGVTFVLRSQRVPAEASPCF